MFSKTLASLSNRLIDNAPRIAITVLTPLLFYNRYKKQLGSNNSDGHPRDRTRAIRSTCGVKHLDVQFALPSLSYFDPNKPLYVGATLSVLR